MGVPEQKMDPAIKEQWVDSLLSERFQQGTGRLRIQSHDGQMVEHCCLGVLSELAVEAGIVVRGQELTEEGACYFHPPGDADRGEEALLPQAVAEWAGLPVRPSVEFYDGDVPDYIAPDESLPNVSQVRDLDDLNDTGFTFAQIAALIKKYY